MDSDDKDRDSRIDPEFLKVLSHQIKSPIHAIQTLLGTVAEGYAGDVDEKVLPFIEKALKRSKEAQEVVSDLLDYQFFTEHQNEQEEFNLVALLEELLESYIPQASEKNISLTGDIPSQTVINLAGNSTGMSHALRNLIENAIKYTPPPGSVYVRMSFNAADKECSIEIADTGYGIPEEEQQSIFKPFFRALKTKSVIAGTGLGLSIVKKVIDNHGGTVTLKSRENEGTTFYITLPFVNFEENNEEAVNREQVVIIGGVTAGPKTAARLRRLNENLGITIVEQRHFLSYAGCGLPSYISGAVSSPKALMSIGDGTIRDVNFFESIQNITIAKSSRAEKIDREHQTVYIKNLETGAESTLRYDYLVLATGGSPIVPDIPGIHNPGIYTLRSLEDAEKIKQELSVRRAREVFILGGGLIGASAVEALIETGARITMLERKAYILLGQLDVDMAHLIQTALNSKGIKIHTGINIEKITPSGNGLAIQTAEETFSADFIILSTGIKPNTRLAQDAELEIGPSGGIKVDTRLRTSDEHIYAVGDCAESINLITGKHEYWPLGSISTKMGRIAADNICNRNEEFSGSIGTAFLKIFDINVARTGLTSRSAMKNGFDPVSVVVTGEDRAHYMKGSEIIILKIIADRNTRKIIGAQGCGIGEVTKRIEVLAFAISQSLTLSEFFKIDLGYAPAYNRPIDLSQTACLFLNNKLDGLVRTITVADFESDMSSYKLIDLSPPEQHSSGSIPGSLNIPLERIRHEKLPYNKKTKIVLYSWTSAGAFTAYRYLVTRGYTGLYVLEGGYILWEKAH